MLAGLLSVGRLGGWLGGAESDAAAGASPIAEAASIRAYIESIHRGSVDKATLDRIVASLVKLHRNANAHAETGEIGVTRDITAYLAAPPQKANSENEAFEKALAQAGRTPPAHAVRVAQNDTPAETDGRTYVGQKTCVTCHEQEGKNWAHTIHSKVFTLHPRDSTEAQGCEACHGPGSAHAEDSSNFANIISFSSKSKTPVPRQNAQCLSCHTGGQRIFWHDSIHESNNVACSDCHNPMADFSAHGLTARASINETCFQCHKVQKAQFSQRSHMPLLEGKITCVDCHNPHGSATSPLMKADSVNEVCYTCHAEKRGPFLFEHAPVRESCLNCHSPHGSNFESLLTVPRPLLCQQCHAQIGHPAQLMTMGNMAGGPVPDPRLIATSCQTCHVNIHGSNSPSGSRFER